MDHLIAKTLEMELDYRKRAKRQREQRILQLQNYKERIAALQKAKEEMEAEEINSKAMFILKKMAPKVVDAETVAASRQELEEAAQAAADEQWEADKQAAGEEARAKAEDLAAERQALVDEYEAAKAAAEEAKASAEEGEEPEVPMPEEPDFPPEVDIEAKVEAAIAAVPKVKPKVVTDQDVLCDLVDKGTVTKDAITHCLAVSNMGAKAYSYVPPPAADGGETSGTA